MQDEILIGAAGQMFSLATPEDGGFTETPQKFGNLQRGLSGAGTVDVHGQRLSFSWSAEDLTEDDCSLLNLLYSQVRGSQKPVRLIPPHRRNLMSASASSARSVARARESVIHYESLAGTTVVTTPDVPRPDQDALYPLSPRLSRYTHLVNAVGDSDYVYPEGNPAPGKSPWTRIPVIEGRTYTLSLLYRRTVAGVTGTDTNLRNFWRREDGDNTSTPAQNVLNLTASTWTWAAMTFTIPTGWPMIAPVIEVGNGATMDVAAMQFEEGNVRTPWVMGRGVPVVYVSSLTFTDSLWPRRNATMEMIEL